MIDVKRLIEEQLKLTKLDILVFGPILTPPSTDPHVSCLQVKRAEIKARLIDEGHNVYLGEDVYDPTLPEHVSDPLLQSMVAMGAADLIFVLLHSPGTIVEAMKILERAELRSKSYFCSFQEHKDGLAVRELNRPTNRGIVSVEVTLEEVRACNLTGMILKHVRAVHAAKAFL